jgi:hypothetical protein
MGRTQVAQNYNFEIEHIAQLSSVWTSGRARLNESIVDHHFPGASPATQWRRPCRLGTYSHYVSLYDAPIKWR